jgi:hypothetical protein
LAKEVLDTATGADTLAIMAINLYLRDKELTE